MPQTIAAGHSEVLGANLNCSESGIETIGGPKAAYDGSYGILLCFQSGGWITAATQGPTKSEKVGSQSRPLRQAIREEHSPRTCEPAEVSITWAFARTPP